MQKMQVYLKEKMKSFVAIVLTMSMILGTTLGTSMISSANETEPCTVDVSSSEELQNVLNGVGVSEGATELIINLSENFVDTGEVIIGANGKTSDSKIIYNTEDNTQRYRIYNSPLNGMSVTINGNGNTVTGISVVNGKQSGEFVTDINMDGVSGEDDIKVLRKALVGAVVEEAYISDANLDASSDVCDLVYVKKNLSEETVPVRDYYINLELTALNISAVEFKNDGFTVDITKSDEGLVQLADDSVVSFGGIATLSFTENIFWSSNNYGLDLKTLDNDTEVIIRDNQFYDSANKHILVGDADVYVDINKWGTIPSDSAEISDVDGSGSVTLADKQQNLEGNSYYSISYDNTKEQDISSLPTTYLSGSEMVIPTLPDVEGYENTGWSLNGEAITAIPADVKADITLTAVWTPIVYTATFMDGTEVVKICEFTIENLSVEEPEVPEKVGYISSWEAYELTTEDVVIQVEREVITYTATFKDGETVVAEVPFTVETTQEELEALEPEVPEKEGYESEWASYVLGAGDITVEVMHNPITYTATFIADGETVATKEFNVETAGAVVAPEVPEKTGYTGVWETYSLGAGNVEINAVYTAIEYTATFMADEKVVKEVPFTVETTEEEFKQLMPEVPTKEGYTGAWGAYELKAENITINVIWTEIVYIDAFTTVLPNTASYVYRVGNANTVALGSLFKALDGVTVDSTAVEVTVTANENMPNVSGVYTANTSDWTKATVQFSGTGIVEVSIKIYNVSNTYSLTLEVIDATNVTAYSGLGNRNSVLLSDITMSSGGSFALSGSTLYGNGFTFDVTDGAYVGTGYVTSNYLVYLSNANLDNVKLVGDVYTSYGAKAADDYNRPLVLSVGNNTIANSYISNCAAPVRVNGGNLEIVNSTLKGGNFANLDIRNGHVVLDNVTTINQVKGNDTAEDGTVVVGLGVVVYYEQVLNTTTIEVKNGLTQYNHLSETQADTYITDSTAKQLTSAMFDSDYSAVQYSDGSDTWVNTGIISMTSGVGDDNISDVDGYVEVYPTMTGATGYVHTKQPTATSISEYAPGYVTVGQYEIAPTYSFDYTSKNYVAKEEGSNDYSYEDNGTVLISMDEGDTFNWDTSILTATKAGQTLDYTVTMNGSDYTGKSIVFDTSGNYTVTYTYTDTNNYSMGVDGQATSYEKTYTKNVYISVSVVKPDAKNAEFTFGSSNTASTQVTIGNNTYVMPSVTATSSTVGSITVSGTTVYYPIVDAYTSDGATSHSSLNNWYMCFPVFKNVVTITDYADSGTGAAVTYNSATTSMPAGLSLTAYSGYLTSTPSGAVSFTSGGADAAFKYQASASASATPTTLDGVLIYASPTLSNNARAELYLVVQYQYQDNVGSTYYYYVGYHMPETTESSGCVTSDTLVTLSDGTQKEIQHVTYEDELLVWDFYKGEYVNVPSAIIFEHGYDNNTVIALNFSDGTTVRIVNLHQFFDAELNKFVTIDGENVAQYVGHSFVKQNGDSYKWVTLVDYTITMEYIEAYGIISAGHYNILVEGMFSTDFMPQDYALFNYFEVGEDMKYDAEQMQADIETYGLYAYEDFADYLTYEQFIAFNVPYFKIAVGKGNYTFEGILDLINEYLN